MKKRSFLWRKGLMARESSASCESLSLHGDLALFSFLSVKERKKLCKRRRPLLLSFFLILMVVVHARMRVVFTFQESLWTP